MPEQMEVSSSERWWHKRGAESEGGMVTSEYAAATIGGCGVACVLIGLSPHLGDVLISIFEQGISPILGGLL